MVVPHSVFPEKGANTEPNVFFGKHLVEQPCGNGNSSALGTLAAMVERKRSPKNDGAPV